MYSELRVLIKVVAFSFYQHHAALFLVAFLLLVGVIPPHMLLSVHLAIINALIQSPPLLLAAIAAWLLYGIKCLQYTIQILNSPGSEVLHNIMLLPLRRQVVSIGTLYFSLYLPIIVYVSISAIISIHNGKYIFSLIVFLFILLVLIIVIYIIQKQVSSTRSEPKHLFLVEFIDKKYKKGYFSFFWSYLLRNDLLSLTITKFISILIISVITNYYITNQEIRILRISFILSVFAHVILVHQLRWFEENRMLFTRNLPITFIKRFINYSIIYFALTVPETLVLLRYALVTDIGVIYSIIEYVCFSVSFYLLCHSYLFNNNVTIRNYLKKVFYFFIICLLMIMFKISLIVISIPIIGSAYVLLKTLYYKYEPVGKPAA